MHRGATILLLLAVGASCAAQNALTPAVPAPHLVIAKLPPPVYPAIARAARVAGDVNLSVTLRRDGTIDAVRADSGPAMLRDHAEEIVRQTRFECANCKTGSATFPLTVRFDMKAAQGCDPDPSYPRVSQSSGAIVLTDQAAMLCDPAFSGTKTRLRSARCLYLWRCSSR